MQNLGLEVRHEENLREHYALTLKGWCDNLEANWDECVREVGEGTAKVWGLYMAGSRLVLRAQRDPAAPGARGQAGRRRRRALPAAPDLAELTGPRRVTQSRVPEFRSGFASFVGRPNAGKSTLTNALVGSKVAITSSRPQTTRTVVRGIVHRPDAQLVLMDTPGLHRPRTLLGERLNDLVTTTWAEVDVVAVCFPADEKVGPGDRFLVNELAKVRRTTKFAVATKTDLATPQQLGEHLLSIAAAGRGDRHGVAGDRAGLGAVRVTRSALLADLLVAQLPEGPPLYPEGELTDAPEETIVAELIREAALEGVRDELPHSIAVVVEEMGLREGPPGGPAAARRPRQPVRRALLAEGHRHRPPGQPAARRRQRRPQRRSRRCSAPRSTSTCTSRSPRTGSATPSSCDGSASEGSAAARRPQPGAQQ